MGTIYRNGVPFVGSGGAGGVEMTMAEYELLPESEKMNGAIYFITDGDVSYPSASQMRYDNTESQIPATTVQGAIDENRIEINALNDGLTQAPKISSATASWVSSFNITLTAGIYLFVGGTSDLKTVEVYSNGGFAITDIYGSGWNVTGSNFVLSGTATSARWYSVIQIIK